MSEREDCKQAAVPWNADLVFVERRFVAHLNLDNVSKRFEELEGCVDRSKVM